MAEEAAYPRKNLEPPEPVDPVISGSRVPERLRNRPVPQGRGSSPRARTCPSRLTDVSKLETGLQKILEFFLRKMETGPQRRGPRGPRPPLILRANRIRCPRGRSTHRKMRIQASRFFRVSCPPNEKFSLPSDFSPPGVSDFFYIVCRLAQPAAYMCAFFYEK